mgnify:CR=1 FL=1
MNKKSDRKVILLFVVVGIILLVFLVYRVNKDFLSKGNSKKQIDSIDFYGYTLTKSDTDYFKSTFKELSKILNEKPVDMKEYAKSISKLFITDVYSLDSKLTSTDIGGLEFLHKDLRDNFKENMGATLYKGIESNIDGKRKQELPMVKEVNITDVFETKYTYNKSEYPAYLVTANWTYEKDLGYQTSTKLTIINDKDILYIVKGN